MYFSDIQVSLFVQLVLEAAAFLTISVVGLSRLIDGAWAALAVVGGGFGALVALVNFASYAEQQLHHTSRILEFLFLEHPHLWTALAWIRISGIVLVAGAFVILVRRRTAGATTGTAETP